MSRPCLQNKIRQIFLKLVAFALAVLASPAVAATCGQAGAQGTAPASWQTYCWIDFSTYSDATARTASGQNFSINLSDGSVLTFNVKTSGSATTAIAAPSWSGAAVGNSAFLSIPGKPVIYQTAGGLTTPSTITISSILITPPSGASAVTAYAFVAADAESTDNSEQLSFTTNGSAWTLLDSVPPISGSSMPTKSGEGTSTFTENGGGVSGNTGAYIVGSNSPTTVTTVLTGSGLQGAMFAVRFASLRLTKQIAGARADAADQFQFNISATSSGAVLATGSTSGTGLGPFTAAAVSLASGLPLTISEAMASGSTNTISHYRSQLTCTNGSSGSTTTLPTGLSTTSYSFGALQFGDAIQCTFTNTPYPHIKVQKALAISRISTADQFTVQLLNGSTVLASSTTTGTGSTVTAGTGATAMQQVNAGTAYTINEVGAGSTSLAPYTKSLSCSNANSGSATSLIAAVGGSITPAVGDVITCTITNAGIMLTTVKSSIVISDPINGTTNPKMIPGATVQYSILVANTSTSNRVDTDTLFILDPIPSGITFDGTFTITGVGSTSPASGLTFSASSTNNLRYASAGTPPTSFTGCSASLPPSSVSTAVAYLCFRPTGQMARASSATAPATFTVTFRGRIK